jgi:uncharacterized protein (DUF1015 family)
VSLIKPFRALRPAPGRAAEVLAPPYDVLSSAEARERAKDKPFSFLHVSKAEIDLDPSINPYDSAVYAKAADNLQRMIASGVLRRDPKDCYYAYRLTWRGGVQTGLAAVASIAAYAGNQILKHELTTPTKEDDRVRQIEAVDAQTGPVMLAYPNAPEIDVLLAQATAGEPAVDVTAEDGVRHQLWVIDNETAISALTRAVDTLPALYIADGHHRSAAAQRVAATRDGQSPRGYLYFLAVLFPEAEMTILEYNRVLRDLNGQSAADVVARLRERYEVEPTDRAVRPAQAHELGMYLAGRWYRLVLRKEYLAGAGAGPIERLPVTLLHRNVIEPIFGVTAPRTDPRIDFVGGGRGAHEIERLVSSGKMAIGFVLYPTQMRDLMAVADAGGIMPPKSTWFEPKLADGMVSHVLD